MLLFYSLLKLLIYKMKQKRWSIYTDGACSPNPGSGAFAAVIIDIDTVSRQEISERSDEPRTTNQRMELKAAIEALRTIQEPSIITVYSDSRYLITGMTTGFSYEQKAIRKGKTPKARPNLDLWVELLALALPHQITWQWIRGHSGIVENERANELAEHSLVL
jgi:ribonuclease HI